MRAGPPAEVVILGPEEVRAALPLSACIELMVQTMAEVSAGGAALPLRTVMQVPGGENRLGVMPGWLARPEALGAKLVCLYPENPRRGLSSHMGVVLLFDPATGALRGLLDAAEVTAIRTAAATAAASRVLARRGAGDLAILGTGEQARTHLEALSIVHALSRVRVWGRDRRKAAAFAEAARTYCPVAIESCAEANDAVRGADLICTTTSSPEPVLEGAWLSPGAHVSLVGASVQTSSEIDSEGVCKARYFVDYRPSALAQAGELKRALDAGLIDEAHVLGEIGEIHLGRLPGRLRDDDITIYKSLGIAAQDLAAADAALAAARGGRFGQIVQF